MTECFDWFSFSYRVTVSTVAADGALIVKLVNLLNMLGQGVCVSKVT